MTADEALTPGSAFQAKREAPARDTAAEFLAALLKDGLKRAQKINAEAAAAGLC